MVDTHRMHRLLHAADPAIIRTLGDPQQAQAVGPGGWHHQVDQAIGGHANLTHVIRQRDRNDRAVCRAIRDGHATWALTNLHQRGTAEATTSSGPSRRRHGDRRDHRRHRHSRSQGRDRPRRRARAPGRHLLQPQPNHVVTVQYPSWVWAS